MGTYFLKDIFFQICFFMLVALWILFPAVQNFGEIIPAAQISDIWNGLWSLDFVHQSIFQGRLPTCTESLNYPKGGCLWPSDMLGALLTLPLSFFSLTQQYTLLVLIQLVITGMGMACLLREIFPKTTILQTCLAGFMMMDSTPMRIAIHNGSTEALSIGWVILALWGFLLFRRGKYWGLGFLLLSILASWYGVVVVLTFMGINILWEKDSRKRALIGAGIYLVLLLPYAYFVSSVSTGKGNLIQIKGAGELDMVRRTIGAMDPLSYMMPYPYVSPDFSLISRYGEQFVHSGYLGWVLLGFGAWNWRKISDKRRFLPFVLLGIVFFILSLGPVLVQEGEPVLFGNLGIPLPYFMLERLWGFSGLSLLFRWGFVPLLGLGLVASTRSSPRAVLLLGLLIALENRVISPVKNLPAFTKSPNAEGMLILQAAPSGAVGSLPIVGGRETLYWQTIHQKEMMVGLNFTSNNVFRRFLDAGMRLKDTENFRDQMEMFAQQNGLRYLIINLDPSIMPDQYSELMMVFQNNFPSVYSAEKEYSILKLY